MKLSRIALAAFAALALSSGAAAQTQPIPSAINANGQPANVGGVAPVIAPAGGAAGRGAVVAEDHGLPVNCISGCSATSGGTATKATAAAPTLIEGSTANQISVDLKGNLRTIAEDLSPAPGTITAADVGSTTIAGQGGVTLVTGTPTANSFQTWTTTGKASLNLTTLGTFVGTMNLEGSSDLGVTYVPISGLLRGTATTSATITGPGVISAEVAGFDHVRVRASAFTSGTATLSPRFSAVPGPIKVTNPLIAGTNSIGNVGLNAGTNSIGNVGVPAVTTGGASPFHLITAASTNSTLVATGARTLYALSVSGFNTTAGWLKVFDAASAPANCGATATPVHSYPVIGSATVQGGMNVPIPTSGEAYASGIAYCFVGGSADNDNSAGPAGVAINGTYK